MFKSNRKQASTSSRSAFGLEPMEGRQLLSASPFMHFGHGGPGGGHGQSLSTIQFSQAPSAVQTGLDNLATTDGLSQPSATQNVQLRNFNGVETYSVVISGTGTVSRLTVDQNGNAVTAPTFSTTTWGTLSGTGTGSNSAVANEISAIATALNLTAPTATTAVNVLTTSDGKVTYSVNLPSASTTTTGWHARRGTMISVDASGNPVGNQQLPFSVIPTTIQNALNANAPSGATALTSTSTQNVNVRTIDGVTLYSTTFTTNGTQTTVTVNATGQLASLPSHSTTTFSALTSAQQTELQTLAAANGYSGTIAGTQSVDVFTEANGTTLYSVTVSASKTGKSGNTYTFNLTITVDANANPTTLPGGFGDRGPGFGPGPGFGGDFGGGDGDHGAGPVGGQTPSGSSTPGSSTSGSSTGNTGGNSGGFFGRNFGRRRH